MKFKTTKLKDVLLIEIEKHKDQRGFFARSFCEKEFHEAGVVTKFIQQNISETKKIHTLRGMHYQIGNYAEEKYIRCHTGKILDVIVDLRRDSPTFLAHECFLLTEENFLGLYVPKGFAHGFLTLKNKTTVSYLVSSEYSAKSERGIRWNDNNLSIEWPINKPHISDKDANHSDFDPSFMALDKNYEPLLK